MMQLKNNQAPFQVVDGSHKGRKYEHVMSYEKTNIPEQELHKFTQVKKAKAPKASAARDKA